MNLNDARKGARLMFNLMKPNSPDGTLGYVTKKNDSLRTKRLLNRYVQQAIIPSWVMAGRGQKALAERSGVNESAISLNKKRAEGLDIDSIERLATALGQTFQEFLDDAIEWESKGSAKPLDLTNMGIAERSVVTLGFPLEAVRAWANTVALGLPPGDESPPHYLAQRILMERERQNPTLVPLKRPDTWADWKSVRDGILLDDSFGKLTGPMIGFGETPTAEKRPTPLDRTTLRPLVAAFAASHPIEAFPDENSDWDKKARRLYAMLSGTHPATVRPKTSSEPITTAPIPIGRRKSRRR